MRIRSRISGRDMHIPTSQRDVTNGNELMRRIYTLKTVQRRRMVTGRLSFMSFVSVYLFHHSILSFFLPCFYRPSILSFLPSSNLLSSHHYKQLATLISYFLLFFLSSFLYLCTFLASGFQTTFFSDIPQTSPTLN